MALVSRALLALALFVPAACTTAAPALARTLEVGKEQEFKSVSAAVAAANSGDTISIEPGQYFDCAIVKQNNLTIQGKGPGVVLTDKPCGGKALLVIAGKDVTVRDITLQRARVPDKNGAGIRAEGGNLTVINSRFLDNENGILAADMPDATIRIIGSEFIGNGKCDPSCAHGVYVNRLALLHVEKSRFFETKTAHHIKSRALRTEVINSDIRDGENGSSSYLIEVPNGGSLIVEGNTMEKGPRTDNQANAIMIGAEGITQPTDELIFKNNTFINDQNRPTTFVHNITATRAQLIGNVFKGQVRPLDGDGTVR
ncbi:MAG: hypothetical protein WDN25_10120 [Acetobacteraceae bacterium]